MEFLYCLYSIDCKNMTFFGILKGNFLKKLEFF